MPSLSKLSPHPLENNQKYKVNELILTSDAHPSGNYNPEIVKKLQEAVSAGSRDVYKEYSKLVDQRPPAMLRDLLAVDKTKKSVLWPSNGTGVINASSFLDTLNDPSRLTLSDIFFSIFFVIFVLFWMCVFLFFGKH